MIMENLIVNGPPRIRVGDEEETHKREELGGTLEAPVKRRFKRMHQRICGFSKADYDSYEDVKMACEKKLREWERLGLLVPWRNGNGNDWLFGQNH
jgi:hypothetical protein